MTLDARKLAREFDDEFLSNVQKHEKKVNAISTALQIGEKIAFITDVRLMNSFSDDVVVMTNGRYLTIRKNGKRIDAHDLCDIESLTLGDPSPIGSDLAISFGKSTWKAFVKSQPAAVALTHILQDTALTLRTEQNQAAPILTLPESASVDPSIWKMLLSSDREYGTSIAPHLSTIQAIPKALGRGEKVLAISTGRLSGAVRADILVCTNNRLLTVRRDGDQVDSIDLSSIHSTNLGTEQGGRPGTISITYGKRKSKWEATIESQQAAELFSGAVRNTSMERRLELSASSQRSSDHEPYSKDKSPPAFSQHSPRTDKDITSPALRELGPRLSLSDVTNTTTSLHEEPFLYYVERLDHRFGTNIGRHESKLAVLPEHIADIERVLHIAEGKLPGAFRSDLFVSTNSRLIIIRHDGARVDAYEAEEMREFTLPDPNDPAADFDFELNVGGETKTLKIRGTASATVLAWSLFRAAAVLREAAGLDMPVLHLPPGFYQHDPILASNALVHLPTLDLGEASSGWIDWTDELESFRRNLDDGESLLASFSVYPEPMTSPATVALTDQRLLLQIEESPEDLVSPILGPRYVIDTIPYSSMSEVSARQSADSDEWEIVIEWGTHTRTLATRVPLHSAEHLIEDIRELSGLRRPSRFEKFHLLWAPLAANSLTLSAAPTAGTTNERSTYEMSYQDRARLYHHFSRTFKYSLDNHRHHLQDLDDDIAHSEHIDFVVEMKRAPDGPPELLALCDDRISFTDATVPVNTIRLYEIEVVSLASSHNESSISTFRLTTVDGEFNFLSVPLEAASRLREAIESLQHSSEEQVDHEIEDASTAVHSPHGVDVRSSVRSYRPTTIHTLDEEALALAYGRMANETSDFSSLTEWQLGHLPEVMLPTELLLWLAEGYLQGSFKDPGDSGRTMIAITDRRLLLLVDPLLATKQVKAFRLADMTAVHRDGGLVTGGFRFREAGGGQRKITKMRQDSAEATVAKLQAAIDAAHAPQPPAPHAQEPRSSVSDVADQLEKLANLVDRGFLTPEEFAEQKAKLLNS